MSKPLQTMGAIVLAVALVISLYLLLRGDGTGNQKQSGPPDSITARTSPFPPFAHGNTGAPGRPDEVERLRQQWLRIKRTGVNRARFQYTEETLALARRTIRELGCGEKLIALINGLLPVDDAVDDIFEYEIKPLLAGKDGVLHHQAIAAIRSDPKLRLRWSYFAGKGCSAAEQEAFTRLLAEPVDRSAAQMGLLVKAADKDPVSALKAIADNLGDGTSGVDKVMVYQDIIAAAADVATFPSVEVELRSTPAFTAFKPRRDFLKKWGAVDGVGLAGYFNTHPDQLSGDDVSSAMATITEKSPEKAFAMAQHFDSPAHFDRAVKFLMPYFYSRHPQEATELVQQLSSPADRNYYLNMIKNGLEDDINRD